MFESKSREALVHLDKNLTLSGEPQAPQSDRVGVLFLAFVGEEEGVELLVEGE